MDLNGALRLLETSETDQLLRPNNIEFLSLIQRHNFVRPSTSAHPAEGRIEQRVCYNV